MTNHFQLIPLFAGAINLLLALFVFTRDPKLRINQVFLFWGVVLSAWNFGAFTLFRVSDPGDAALLARLTHFPVIFIPVAVLHLAALLSRRALGRWLQMAYLFSVAVAVSNFGSLFVADVRNVGYAWFAVAGPVYWIYVGGFMAMTWPALYLTWRARTQAQRGQERRYTTLLAANTLLLTLGSNDLLPVLGFDTYPSTRIQVYPWGQFGASLYGLLVAHSVLHDQILDIRISLGRQAATMVRLLFLVSMSYMLLALGAWLWPHAFTLTGFIISLFVLLVSAVAAGLLFPRLLGGNTESLERKILGDRFEYQEQMRSFIARLPDETEMPSLLSETVSHMRDVMRLQRFHVVIYDTPTFEIKHCAGFPTPIRDAAVAAESPLLEYFRKSPDGHLDLRNPRNSSWPFDRQTSAREAVEDLSLVIVFPLRRQTRFLGMVFFGEKEGGRPFTQIDLEICTALADSLSHAVDRLKMAERAALSEKLELLAVMSRGLAHDLNNLITPISTYLQIQGERLQAGDEDAAIVHRIALQNTQTIRSYVHEAIFFANSLTPKLNPINTRSLLENVQDLTRERAARRGCTIRLKVDVDCTFVGDRILLQRMLGNLVNNAVDASSSGQTVTVCAAELPKTKARGAWLRFDVSDEGSGISPENLPRVFEPYFSTKDVGDQTRGFGLGLTIVQKVVFLHHGSVRIDSKPGKGTTVSVDIPQSPEEAERTGGTT